MEKRYYFIYEMVNGEYVEYLKVACETLDDSLLMSYGDSVKSYEEVSYEVFKDSDFEEITF